MIRRMQAVEAELSDNTRLGYRPELDGLRAFAVFAVLASHYWTNVAPGGFLGVDLFFVLSGFLISRLLLEELARSSGIGFKRFYARRAARLFPAVVLVCLLVALDAVTIRSLGAPGGSFEAIAAALFYATNWFGVFAHLSPGLGHLWSLAVEEQFYAIWPIALFAAYRRGGLRLVQRVAALVFIVASVEMAARSFAGVGWYSLYLGTDAHPAVMLMAGCFLATIATTRRPERRPPIILDVVTGIFIVAVAVLVLRTAEFPSWWYRGGFPVVALGFALVINRALTADAFTAVLRVRPVAWVGRLSYGIYVYHLGVHACLAAELHGRRQTVIGIASIALTLVVATCSYYLIEQPIRSAVAAKMAVRTPTTSPTS